MIYTIRELRNERGNVIQEAELVSGDFPDDFCRYQAAVQVQVGVDPRGQAIVARGMFPIDAETADEAFEALQGVVEAAAATMKAKAMQEVTRPRIALPNGTFKLRE